MDTKWEGLGELRPLYVVFLKKLRQYLNNGTVMFRY